ncbi:MAG TPA: MFS transporter [Candidatus Limnocylindria bacterium]|nr:MFS transporter [Candidatus Limnocylindria bacterium]
MTAPAIGAATRPNLTLGLLSLAHSLIHMQSALMPLVYIAVIDQFGLDEAAIGLFIGVTTAIAGAMQLSYGFLTRYIARPVLIGVGQLVFGVSLMLAGFASSIGQLLAAISGARVGASPQHPVGNGILSDAFPPERRGFAISTHIAGGNVGTILVPFIGGALLATVGWNTTLLLFGIPPLVVGGLVLWFVREDTTAYRREARASGSWAGQVRAVLGRSDLMRILAAALVSAGGRGLDIAAPFLLLYFRAELGIDDSTVLWLYALLLVGAVVGPVLAGILSDRYGRRRTLIWYYALSSVGILSVVLAGGNLLLLAPLLLPFGTAVFSEGPILQAFLADRAVGPLRDVAFSIYFTAAFGIGALWALAIGAIVAGPGYVTAFVVMAISYVAGAVLISSVRDRPPDVPVSVADSPR